MIFSENSLRVTSTLISLRNFELKQPATSHRHVQRRSSCHQAAHAQSTSRASQSLDSIFNVLSSGAAKLQRSFSSPSPGFPPGPRTDVALGLLQDPLAFLESTQQKYGDVVGVSLAGERAVIITDPQAAKTVLVDEPAAWVKAGTAFFPGSSLAGNGLLVSDGPIWRRQRQLATPAFRRAAVERYGASMVACTANALRSKRWRDGAVRDVYADFNELTLRITLNALFGADMGAAEALEVTGAMVPSEQRLAVLQRSESKKTEVQCFYFSPCRIHPHRL